MGFEPTRAEHIGLAFNHSATSSQLLITYNHHLLIIYLDIDKQQK